jgi:ketosteroid isomerase-like protein
VTDTDANSDANIAVVRRAIAAVERGDSAQLRELFAADHVDHLLWHQPLPLPGDETQPLLDRYEEADAKGRADFPEGQFTIEEQFACGDRVVSIVTMRATAAASGRAVELRGMVIDRVVAGKIVESWSSQDRLGLFQQLGVVPATPELISLAGLTP